MTSLFKTVSPDDVLPIATVLPWFPGAARTAVEQNYPLVLMALQEHQLLTPALVAAALGTIAAEVAGFVPIRERVSRWNTKVRPFDLYDRRRSLGNQGSPDGWRYRGAGFIQLTGRDNFTRYGERVGIDLEAFPERANEPVVAAQLLALFLGDRAAVITAALQAGDYAKARRQVNGGLHGLERFQTVASAALVALGARGYRL